MSGKNGKCRWRALLGSLALLLTLTGPLQAHYGARFEPPDGTIYHGCGWDGYESQAFYNSMFPADHHPLILQVVTDMPGMRGMDVARTIRSLTDHIVHADSQYIEFGVHFRDRFGMLDSVFALTTTMDHYMDTLATAFLTVNRPFFLRIGFEFNGWWNPYHPYLFPLAFRKLVTGLRERGVTNFATVWCYEPDAPADFADSSAAGWRWYPGDDMVDWFGLDPFDVEHFHPDLPDSNREGITRKGKTELFLRFAEARGKPVYLNELSAQHVNIVPDSLDPDHTEGQADWELWFEPFFRFVRNHPGIKGWNYINLEWTRYETYADWGDARLEINSYIRERWVDSLLTERFLNAGYDITQVVAAPVPPAVPHAFDLEVFPNPFNPHATLRFRLEREGRLVLDLYNVQGQRVARLTDQNWPAGDHALRLDLSAQAAGLYFLRAEQGRAVQVRKLVLLK